MENIDKKVLTKLESFCAYQERSAHDVKNKYQKIINARLTADSDETVTHNLEPSDINDYIQELENGNFLNEERFITSYVRGKVNLKKWGRVKILRGLHQHHVTPSSIDPYIENKVYFHNLHYLADKKWNQLKNISVDKKNKLYLYLLSKGYAPEEINCISELN